ncbi:hypothetical protein F5I97DRAFT_117041 [Phlebopus sp. FC_14]|nr:hypothetical protein F5I97DRAFT_117041 [Phlebopus sp. FC_14]
MSTLQPNLRPPPPGDEDLQNLYDEVWRIFGEETVSPTERSPTSAISASSRDLYPNGLRTEVDAIVSPVSSTRTALPRPPPSPAHPPDMRANLDSAVSPTTQRRLRPLPLPPTAPAPPAEPHGNSHDVISPVASPSRPGTANIDGRRNLPQAPSVQLGGYHSNQPSIASITSPTLSTTKPAINGIQSEVTPNIHKPVPAVPPYANANGPSPAIDDYRTQPSASNQDIRDYQVQKVSARPPGALAPKIPGHDFYDESSLLDMYSAEESPKNRLGYRQQYSDQLRPSDIYSQPHARLPPHDDTNVQLNHPSSSSDFVPHRECQTQICATS